MEEFGLDPAVSHIVNGHVPVKRKDGENPVKCGGKVLVIDGGFSKAYQKETGIAGYTLIFNSYGLLLVAHEPFESTESAIAKEKRYPFRNDDSEKSQGEAFSRRYGYR